LYTDTIPAKGGEKCAKAVVKPLDIAYGPEGTALCLFYGPTPVTEYGHILPYSPVNIIGRITSTPPANM
jgi:uncharacterized protein